MRNGRVTQEDVARKAGVTRATVSMALKGTPSIPLGTRKRIGAIAKKLGYAPDPMLSALAVYRSQNRPASFHGNLAWIVNSSFGYDWRKVRQFVEYHEGATNRAKHHGFQIEIFDLNEDHMTADRLGVIFRTRNIRGCLLCPQPRSATTLSLPWDAFSSITFGYTLASPHLNTVISTQYQDAQMTMHEVLKRGYRRVGLFLNTEHNYRTNENYLAGYLIANSAAPQKNRVPRCEAAYDDVDKVRLWIDRYKPDAVVACGGAQCLSTFKRLGQSIPQDLGVAFPNLSAGEKQLSGVVEKSREIGAVAIDMLVAMMQRGERGIPELPLRVHVEGKWQEGGTLRSV